MAKLEWIRRQVAPTVAKLIDGGHGDRLLDSLFPNATSREAVFDLLGAVMREQEAEGNGGNRREVEGRYGWVQSQS